VVVHVELARQRHVDPEVHEAFEALFRVQPRVIGGPAGDDLDRVERSQRRVVEVQFQVHVTGECVDPTGQGLPDRPGPFVDLLEHVVVIPPFSTASASQVTVSISRSTRLPSL